MTAINVKNLQRKDSLMTKIYFNDDGDVVLSLYENDKIVKKITFLRYELQMEEIFK